MSYSVCVFNLSCFYYIRGFRLYVPDYLTCLQLLVSITYKVFPRIICYSCVNWSILDIKPPLSRLLEWSSPVFFAMHVLLHVSSLLLIILVLEQYLCCLRGPQYPQRLYLWEVFALLPERFLPYVCIVLNCFAHNAHNTSVRADCS